MMSTGTMLIIFINKFSNNVRTMNVLVLLALLVLDMFLGKALGALSPSSQNNLRGAASSVTPEGGDDGERHQSLKEVPPASSTSARTSFLPRAVEFSRTQLTIESNSLGQQNLIGYLIANLKPKLWEERASQIHIPSRKLHFVSHLCSHV